MRPEVHFARKKIPGHVRQKIKRIIDSLGQNPHPPHSRLLSLPDKVKTSIKAEWVVRRIRLENWRIVYAVNETWREIAVLNIKRRPPYDYDDLELLLSEL